MIERLAELADLCSCVLVPLMAAWAILSLYAIRSGVSCTVTECTYYAVLLLIAGCTIRTVAHDDGNWLIHTATLGVMIVAGVMRRPAVEAEHGYRFESAETPA